MIKSYKKGAAALGLALGLVSAAAFAQSEEGNAPSKPDQPSKSDQGQQGQQGQPGIYPMAQQGPGTPQHWIADAALFIGNASNTANVLGMEQQLDVASPQVLGNQAQFLLAATNRALSSLLALQQSAEGGKPGTVNDIRSAVGHLVAAQAQAAQVADAASAGIHGPAFDTTVRSAQNHLTAASRALLPIGRAYGATQLAMSGSCPMRAFGAGLGGQRVRPVKPANPDTTKPDATPPPAPPANEPKQE
jgi:hypothetical protein